CLSTAFVYRSGDHLDLPSFPTRRSSDLSMPTRPRSVSWNWNPQSLTILNESASPLTVPMPFDCSVKNSSSASVAAGALPARSSRSEEHTSELQSRENLVCRLLLEKKTNT